MVEQGTDRIRVIVMKELPEEEQNALLHLFSAMTDKIKYGKDHYSFQSDETSTIVGQLFGTYRGEGLTMPYTIEDFKRDILRDHMADFPPGERLVGLTAEERLAGMPPEQRLAGLAPEQRLAGLAPEQRLAGLSIEQIESFLNREKKRLSVTVAKKTKPTANRSATAGRKKK